MGHFGRAPIGLSWLCFVLPALMLNYMGQGAMVLEADMGARLGIIQDPFFLMMPDTWRIPVVLLAILATIIASQAVISGAFSSEERRVGKECVRPCRSRWSQYLSKKKTTNNSYTYGYNLCIL